jgi:hypothetical protein
LAASWYAPHTEFLTPSLDDREHEDSREQDRLNRAERARNEEIKALHSKQEYEYAKAAISSFMSSSYHFVSRQTNLLNNLLDTAAKADATAANEKVIDCYQLVVLLADEELEIATLELWNAVLDVPTSSDKHRTPEYQAVLLEYRQARTNFNVQAKRFLRTLAVEVA